MNVEYSDDIHKKKIYKYYWLTPIFILFIIYIYTMPPDFCFEGDSTEFVLMAQQWGIPHGNGYPLFILLAKLFIKIIPFGSIAFRVYLLSALCGLLTIIIIAKIIFKILDEEHFGFLEISFIILLFGLSRDFWKQCISAEVYTLHILLITIIVYITFFENLISRKIIKLSIFLSLGLANHLTTIFIIPFIVLYTVRTKIRIKINFTLLLLSFFIFIFIFFLFYYNFFIAYNFFEVKPEIKLHKMEGFKDVINLVTMKQYEEFHKFDNYIGLKLKLLRKCFLKNFDFVFLVIGLIGIIYFYKKSKDYCIYLLTIIFSFLIFTIILYKQVNSKAVIDTLYVFFLPIYCYFSIFIYMGIIKIKKIFINRNKKGLYYFFVFCIYAVLIVDIIIRFPIINQHGNDLYVKYIDDILKEVPDNGILLTDNDNIQYGFWYNRIIKKKYGNKMVLHINLLKNKVYLKNVDLFSKNNFINKLIYTKPQNIINKIPEDKLRFKFKKYQIDFIKENKINLLKYQGLTRSFSEENFRHKLDYIKNILKKYRKYKVPKCYGIRYDYSNVILIAALKELNEKKEKEGVSLLLEIIDLNPYFYDAYYNLGIYYKKIGFYKKSDMYFEKAEKMRQIEIN